MSTPRAAERARSGIPAVAAAPGSRRSGTGLRRGLGGLVAVPLLVVLGFAVLAVVAVLADQTEAVGALSTLRQQVGRAIGAEAASATLQAVATGLVTVTSITFSVLLLAVQQTASTLSPVVFDQFLRRKTNQLFLGFFVGLVLFAYVVMTAVEDGQPPILGAALATALTVVALFILLALVFSTVDQMRPTSVVRAIRDGALAAREREARLVRGTRRRSQSRHPVGARCRAVRSGYLTEVVLHRLQRALRHSADAEVVLQVRIGDYVAYGQVLAEVRDSSRERAEAVAAELSAGLKLLQNRDMVDDPTTGVDELANIAWTSGSSSKQNPEIAREALAAIRDLGMRWLLDDPVHRDTRTAREPLPVVYRDDDLERILDVLYGQLVVAHESHQPMVAADVLDTYRALHELAPEELRARLAEDVTVAGPLLDQSPPSRILQRARRLLDEQLQTDRAQDTSPPAVTA